VAKQASQPAPQGFQLSSLLSVNLLLVFLPIALIGRASGWSDIVVFITSALAIIPLAGLIGHSTEALAVKLGSTIGGLINVTLGNAAELIITIFALRAGLVDLVKASIVGSILGNLLLIMGLSFIIGGLKNGIQQFNRRSASMNATMVIFAFLAIAIPSAFDEALLSTADGLNRELFFSEGIALVLITLYVVSIVYTLRSPKAPLSELEKAQEEVAHETHADVMSTRSALGLLAFATIGIVLMSEALVGTVETVGHNLGLSEFFIGIIIVPLIGNVAEHLVAVQVAYKNRMDLSVNISLGSSLQIALFVAPVLVFISLLFEKKLLLVFTSYELVALAAASVVAALVAQDGESNWVEGVQLLAVYIIFGLAFYLLPAAAGAVH
jgi:Ca2+:H+ antiporter